MQKALDYVRAVAMLNYFRRPLTTALVYSLCLLQVHNLGAVVLLGAFGDPSEPYTHDPQEYGASAAQWVIDNRFDGIDFTPPPLSQGLCALLVQS